MKNKIRNTLILTILLIISLLIFSNNSLATEDENIIQSSETVDYDNYFEVREEGKNNEDISTASTVEAKTYLSSTDTEALKEYILAEAIKGTAVDSSTAIDVSSYSLTTDYVYNTLLSELLLDPNFYFVSQAGYTYSGTTVYGIFFVYILTADEIAEYQAIIDEVSEDYLSGVDSNWSDLEKIIYTNDYLCKNCVYASTIDEISHTLAGALVNGTPVCDGYSKAFKYLINQVGITSYLTTSVKLDHAWNIVYLNGYYYNLDVTWNDSISDSSGYGKTSYDYFLTSDDEFYNNRGHNTTDWVSEYESTSTKFDSDTIWNNTDNYLIYKDNLWYYLSTTNMVEYITINTVSFRTNEPVSSESSTKVNCDEILFWSAGLTTDDEYLYFTTETKIWKMTFAGEDVTEFFDLSTVDTSLIMYSVEYRDYKFYYNTTVLSGGASSTSTKSYGIYAPVVQISLDVSGIVLEQTNTQSLTASLLPTDATDQTVTWSSSNTAVATVDANGLVTAVGEGTAIITATTSNGLTATCEITVVNNVVFTNYDTEELENDNSVDVDVIIFSKKTTISTILTEANFPVLGGTVYSIEVYDASDNSKAETEYIGSNNIIRISDKYGNVAKEYTAVVKGDVTGNGYVKMYDSFQILKDVIKNTTLSEIDVRVRDYTEDGYVKMYDSFQFLKDTIKGL